MIITNKYNKYYKYNQSVQIASINLQISLLSKVGQIAMLSRIEHNSTTMRACGDTV